MVVAECAPAENVGPPTSKAKSANLLNFVIEKMESLEETYNGLGKKLEDQSVANDVEEATKINKTLASMQEQVDTYNKVFETICRDVIQKYSKSVSSPSPFQTLSSTISTRSRGWILYSRR